jgi:Ca-activated chloride channel family protein
MKKLQLILMILCLSSYYLLAQTTVTGKVTDEKGSGLPGVSVLVKGTTIGTMTLNDGTYKITVPEGKKTLVFSYIAMKTQEIAVTGTVIDVVMKSDIEIEEVVVTALAITRDKKSLAYSTQSVNGNNVSNNIYDNNPQLNTEEYDVINENKFKDAKQNPLSTLSIDVDNASYTNVRRYLTDNQMPPKDAVRIEEMINYFDYDYPNPTGEHPFSFITEISESPWNKANKLLHIGIQGKKLNYEDLKPSNLVFLIDVSGSMSDVNKLPLLKKAFMMLVDQLDDRDKVSIVVYAGAAGLVLSPTPGSDKKKIKSALDSLNAGGSTAGGAGIELAYDIALKNFIKDGNNRVILATDGDFNTGVSSTDAMVRLIEEKRKSGIYLTILGFGMGNYKDGRMEQISNAGNGNYFYIDNIKEAEKVFVKQMRANMFTIAKDVKIQIEFNPVNVKAYRLIGYENRVLANEDFNNDLKDAGELGAGHTVTAIYEIIPAGSDSKVNTSDPLKYQTTKVTDDKSLNKEIMTLKFRYKPINSNKSILIEKEVKDSNLAFDKTSNNFRFTAAVAAFGMILRDSEFKGTSTYDMIIELAKASKGADTEGYRDEFIRLVEIAKLLDKK